MSSFPGFPERMRFTPIPNVFFSQLMPQIDDLAELKATLYIFWKLYQKRGYPKFVAASELLADRALMTGLGSAEALRHGLGQAVTRGTVLCLALERSGGQEDLYFLNTEADRRAMAKIASGEISLGALPKLEPCAETEERPNIFTLYEENIGMLTPIMADELREAEKLYPRAWVEDAFKEAVSLNKRNWRYISRILERWASEGKEDGTPERDTKESRDKYIKGRYGHLVKRRLS